MTRRPFLFAALLALALLGLLPAGASAVVRAQGTITAVSNQPNTYVLTIENTGTEQIECMRFTAASGVTITSASPPGELVPPNRIVAGPGIAIAPGNSRNFTFTTQSAYPTNGGGTLEVSATCATGSDFSARGIGRAAANNPPPPDPSCLCSGLTAKLINPTIHALHGRFLGFKIRWTLKCTAGAPNNCRGRIRVVTRPGNINITGPRSRRVNCRGRHCPGGTRGTRELRMILPARLRPLANAPVSRRRQHKNPYPPIRIQLRFACLDAAGNARQVPARTLTVKFDRYGQVDRRRSNLG
jgi:hypothetical protein